MTPKNKSSDNFSRQQLLRVLLVIGTRFLSASAQGQPYVLPAGNFDAGLLQNVAFPGQCLKSTSSSFAVTIAPCDFGDQWQWMNFPNFVNYQTTSGPIEFFWESKYLGLAQAESVGNGAGVAAWGRIDTRYQNWKVVNGVWNGDFKLAVDAGGRCLTLEDVATKKLDLYDCQPEGNALHQTWRVIQYPRGTPTNYAVQLKSVGLSTTLTPLCLTVKSSLTKSVNDNQAPVGVLASPCAPSNRYQLWNFLLADATTSLYRIQNVGSGKCLQVDGAGTWNQARVTQWECLEIVQFYWYERGSYPTTVGSSTWFLGKGSGANPGRAITEEDLGAYSDIYDYVGAGHQQFNYITPAQYMKPFNGICGGNSECLSGNCVYVLFGLLCGPGGAGKPCQTKADCTSGNCHGGTCA